MGPGQVTFRHARVWVTQVVPDGLFDGLCFDRPLEPLVSPGTFFLSRSHSLQLKQPQRGNPFQALLPRKKVESP